MPTPPTLISYTEVANWTSSGTPKVSASISWQAGDVVVVIQGDEGNAAGGLSAPTATGLSFVNKQIISNPGTLCGARIDVATPAGSGSATVSCTNVDGTTAEWGFGVWVWRGSAGVGNTAQQSTATDKVPLTPLGADGAICWASFDFAAGAAGSLSPAPTNTRQNSQIAGRYTFAVADLADQVSSSAVSYGTTATGGPFSIVAAEIRAAAGAAGGSPPLLDRHLRTPEPHMLVRM